MLERDAEGGRARNRERKTGIKMKELGTGR